MADYTVSIPDEYTAVVAHAFASAYGVQEDSTGVIQYLGKFVLDTTLANLHTEALAQAVTTSQTALDAATTALQEAFGLTP